MYGKQKVSLFVCVFGQLGAVVFVEDYVFVYMCGCVKLTLKRAVCVQMSMKYKQ